jgi:hypothetical protein
MKNISKLNINKIVDNLYITGMVNKLFEDIANYGEGEIEAKVLIESIIKEEKGKSIISDIIDEYKLAPKFLFTFGTGIGAFIGPVTSLLEGSGINISENSVYLLVITAIAILLNETNVSGLIQKLKEEGLYSSLESVKNYIKSVTDLVNGVTRKVLGVSYSLADILAFTSLLIPVTNMLNTMIETHGLTMGNFSLMIKGILLSMAVYGVKHILKRIKNKISN